MRLVAVPAAEPQLLAEQGAVPQVLPPPGEFKKFVDSEVARRGELVEKAGILHSQ